MMHRPFLLAAFTGLVLAAPRPQEIDIAGVEAVADPVFVTPAVDVVAQTATYSPTFTVESQATGLSRRSTCAKQAVGSAPATTPDTPDDFVANTAYADLANNATTPDGYASAYTNLQSSLAASSYLGIWTMSSYDTLTCANKCNRNTNCVAFNVYIERDPSTATDASACSNPSSTANFKCAIWGAPISSEQVTVESVLSNEFEVVFAGNNGYNKNTPPSSLDGFQGPLALGGAINAPLDSRGYNTYLGYKYYPFSQSQGYTPLTCASACNTTTAFDKKHVVDAQGNYMSCNFFVAYVLSKNGVPQGLYCSMYNTTWSSSYGNNYGSVQGSNRYTVSQAYAYSLQSYLDSLNVATTTTTVSTVTPAISTLTESTTVTSIVMTTVTVTPAAVTISAINKPGLVLKRDVSTSTSSQDPAATASVTALCQFGTPSMNGTCMLSNSNSTIQARDLNKRQYQAPVTATDVIISLVTLSPSTTTTTKTTTVTSTSTIYTSVATPTVGVCDAQYFVDYNGYYPDGTVGVYGQGFYYPSGVVMSEGQTLAGKLQCCALCFSTKNCLSFYIYSGECYMMVRTQYAGAGDTTDMCPYGRYNTIKAFGNYNNLRGLETGPCNPE